MKNRLKGIILLLLIGHFSFSQEKDTSNFIQDENLNVLDDTLTNQPTPPLENFIINPTLGLGIGMFSFFGDLYDRNFQSPTVSRIAYDLSVSQALSENFSLSFSVLFGKLGANERLAANNRNLNFESQIRAGGINLAYNFGHFLPKNRKATPYVSLGFESFEFLSKTDALDANGNPYFYWTDGTIRNIDQNAPDANTAVELKRDYIYESDIREMNLDGFGKYQERSFAIPVGLGVMFEINDFIQFKLGTAMHFTFTDYIDGVTFTSKGNRQGNNKDDKFMMTSCAISYNFGSVNKPGPEMDYDSDYQGIDFLAIDSSDYDKDGVVDLWDSCQRTPIGEIVDYKGCPIDSDDDNYPNYKDEEINSPANVFVDVKGVQLSDAQIEDNYLRYLDPSLNMLDFTIYRQHKGVVASVDPSQKVYKIDLGTYSKGLPADVMTQFLNVKDISANNIDKTTTNYSAGKFNNLQDAENRLAQLQKDGLSNLKIVYTQNGKVFDAQTTETKPETTIVSNTIESEKQIAEEIKEIETEEEVSAEVPVAITEEPAKTVVKTTPVVQSETKPEVAIIAEPLAKETPNSQENIALMNAIQNLATKIENVQSNLETLSAKVEKRPDTIVVPEPIVVKEETLNTSEMENSVKELSAKLDVIQASIEASKADIETPSNKELENEHNVELENTIKHLVSEIEEMKASMAKVNKMQTEEREMVATLVNDEKTANKNVVTPTNTSSTSIADVSSSSKTDDLQKTNTEINRSEIQAETITPTDTKVVKSETKTPIVPIVKSTNVEDLQKSFTDIDPSNVEPNTDVSIANKVVKPKETTSTSASINTQGIVLRVQIGAYNNPIPKKAFKGIDDILEIRTEDGLYKYLSGAFSSFDDAAKHKLDLVLNGYQGAFITAFKNGKRISLKEAGATPVKEGDKLDTPDNKQSNNIRKDLVEFKIQVGVFKNQPPNDKLDIFAKIKDITGEKTKSGLTRYVAGSYNNYEDAVAEKEKIASTFGLTDAFIVALFNNEYISIQEAVELLK